MKINVTITFADGRNDLVVTVSADAMIVEIIRKAASQDPRQELSVKFNGRVQSRISQLRTLSPENSEIRLELFKGW